MDDNTYDKTKDNPHTLRLEYMLDFRQNPCYKCYLETVL